METQVKIYQIVLQFSTVALTVVLGWFAFIYYPKIVNDYKTGNFPTEQVITPVVAGSKKFPIETSAYRIVAEVDPAVYYVFVEGDNLERYLVNRDSAKLALKSALSVPDLCGKTVVFVSTQDLEIPEQFIYVSDC